MKSVFFIVGIFFFFIASAQTTNKHPFPLPPDSVNMKNAQVFTFVEQAPEFPGGDGELINFLKGNVVYPVKERRKGIQGKVIVKFVVYEDGTVHDAEVVRSSNNKALDAEAIRVVKLLPAFKPGMQQGRPVKVYFNLPIVFKLS